MEKCLKNKNLQHKNDDDVLRSSVVDDNLSRSNIVSKVTSKSRGDVGLMGNNDYVGLSCSIIVNDVSSENNNGSIVADNKRNKNDGGPRRCYGSKRKERRRR